MTTAPTPCRQVVDKRLHLVERVAVAHLLMRHIPRPAAAATVAAATSLRVVHLVTAAQCTLLTGRQLVRLLLAPGRPLPLCSPAGPRLPWPPLTQ